MTSQAIGVVRHLVLPELFGEQRRPEGEIVKAAERLSADGKYAMAAELIETAEPKFPNSDALKHAKKFAYLKLMEKNQNTDPFKFIIYSSKAGEQTGQINPADVKETGGSAR